MWILLSRIVLFLFFSGALSGCSSDLDTLEKTNQCAGCNLSYTDLRELFLTNANLQGADLTGSDLSGIVLWSANLREIKLNLGEGDYRKSPSIRFVGASLRHADLDSADLRWADLSGADLTQADLTRANLTGADLSKADLNDADLSQADLTRANLTGADLSNAYFRLE